MFDPPTKRQNNPSWSRSVVHSAYIINQSWPMTNNDGIFDPSSRPPPFEINAVRDYLLGSVQVQSRCLVEDAQVEGSVQQAFNFPARQRKTGWKRAARTQGRPADRRKFQAWRYGFHKETRFASPRLAHACRRENAFSPCPFSARHDCCFDRRYRALTRGEPSRTTRKSWAVH